MLKHETGLVGLLKEQFDMFDTLFNLCDKYEA